MSSLSIPLISASLGLKAKKKKLLCVEVYTKESKFVFDEIPIDATGRDIFERVCRALGLRETQYFSLQYIDNKNTATWLDLKKKIIDQNIVFDRANSLINQISSGQLGLWPSNCSPSTSPSAILSISSPLAHQQLIDQQQAQSPYANTLNQPSYYGNINHHHHSNSPLTAATACNNSTSDYASAPLSHHHQYHSSMMTSSLSQQHLYTGSGLQNSPMNNSDSALKSLNNLGSTSTGSYSCGSDSQPHYLSANQCSSSIFLQQTHPFRRLQHLQASPPTLHQNENQSPRSNYLHYGGGHYHPFGGCSHNIHGSMKTTGRISFDFLVKFFPISFNEIIQDITQHLFFLQIKEYIIDGRIDCTYDKCIRLAALAAQAKFGEFDEKSYRPGMLMASNLLPKRFIQDYQQGLINSAEEEIKKFYIHFKNLSQEEAEQEYLQIAKDLPKCGVSYFPVKGKNGMDLWLGVTALGLNIYDRLDQNQPKLKLMFSEIHNLMYNKKKFKIERWSPIGKDDIVLYSDRTQINEQAYCLCIGYHELFTMRERPETLEMKQMKAQTIEEKQRRLKERAKLVQEKERREKIERDNRELEHRLRQYQEEAQSTHERLCKQEREAQILAEEARLLSRKAAEAEREVQRIKIGSIKAEQEKSQSEVDEAVNNALGAICDIKDIYSRTMSSNTTNNNNPSNNLSSNNPGSNPYNNLGCNDLSSATNHYNNQVNPSHDNNNNNNNVGVYAPISKLNTSFLGQKNVNQLIGEYERQCLDYDKQTQNLTNHLDNIAREIETLRRDQHTVPNIYETKI